MREMTVLCNASCAHCRRWLDVFAEWGTEEGLAVSAIDIERHPAEAERWGAECSPVLVFDDRVAYPGVPDAETFRALARGS